MDRLRETLNPEEEEFSILGPTRYKTTWNRCALPCAECGAVYYVDENTRRNAMASFEADHSEIAFICAECQERFREGFDQ
jgi:hypothetical protein